MDLILPLYHNYRKIERGYFYLTFQAQNPLTVSQNDPPVAQDHHFKMMTQHSKNTTFLKTLPHITGEFSLPSQDTNEYMKVPLES